MTKGATPQLKQAPGAESMMLMPMKGEFDFLNNDKDL